MASPLDVTGSAAEAQPESVLAGTGERAIEGRSLGQIAWMRFKRDKVAVAGGVVVVCMVLLAVLAKSVEAVFGLDPNVFHQNLIDPVLLKPKGAFGGVSWAHPLGVEPQYGRDLLARIIEGSWVSLAVAFGATVLSVTID
jgi:peptide/nickel transport system permease protein